MMFSQSLSVWHTLRRTLDAAREELSLLEADLGLCPRCGERRPPHLPRPGAEARSTPRASDRRVA